MDLSVIDQVVEEVLERMLREKSVNPGGVQKPIENCNRTAGASYDEKIAQALEHSMIRPDATPAMVRQFCEEAVKYKFRNVALAPCFVSLAAQLLKGTGVRVSTAVAFPMGIASSRIKAAEAKEVIENGATEIDLPVNVGMVKAGELRAVKEDIDAVIRASEKKALIKVVVDLGAYTEEEKIKVALIAKIAGADFLKVAATTRPVGVNADDMTFFRRIVGPEMGLKADGGIKDYKAAVDVLRAGGTTIGASGSVKIVTRA